MADSGSRDTACSCSFTVSSVVRGHHIYKDIWTPYVGEQLFVQTEDKNEHDTHAVAIIRTTM